MLILSTFLSADELFKKGRSLEHDYHYLNREKSAKYFEAAANKGLAEAQYYYALLCEEGILVPRDYRKSAMWYCCAARHGILEAQYRLGRLFDKGHVKKSNELGGALGMNLTLDGAVEYWGMAAANGHSLAQYQLAKRYYMGKGVTQNREKSAEWFLKAAHQKLNNAQFSIAECYEKGDGVQQNYANAINWYRKAAYGQNTGATYKLALCYYHGTGVEKDYVHTVKLLEETLSCFKVKLYLIPQLSDSVRLDWQVDEFEDTYFQFGTLAWKQLAHCYEEALGVQKNHKKALQCYCEAEKIQMTPR